MSNETFAAGVGRIVLPPPAFALTPVAWSDGQLERLRTEWLTAQRAFAYHPFVAIAALRGDPPSQYRVDFRVRSLVLDGDGQLQYVDSVSVEIWMPPGYPTQAPLVRPLAAVFHPNIADDGVRFAANWQLTDTLLDVVHRTGEYLAWRSYDPDVVIDSVALQWLTDNPGLLPLDTRADFSSTAGGEPLGRINRFGPATLEQMRKSMAELIAALSGEADGPNVEQVRAFGHQTRLAMRLFLEPDIPAELRKRANDFDQCALDLPASVPSWEHVRRLKNWVRMVLAESGELTAAVTQLSAEVEKLAGSLTAKFDTAETAGRQIPPASELDPFLLHLPGVYTDAATRFETLRARLAAIDLKRPPNPLHDQAVLAKHLKQLLAEADDNVEFARHTATETIAALEPSLLRSRDEVLALRLIGRWREYIDLFSKAMQLEQQLAQMNSDAAEGYFVKSAERKFGPYQFEQEVELGTTTVVVTNVNGGAFEVRDAKSDATLARTTSGSAKALIPSGEKMPTAMGFKLADGIDEPQLQLDYACKHTSALLPKLQSAPASDAQSWCGRMVTLFADPEAQQAARAAHRRAHHRWEMLLVELTELSRFKFRLATHFLVTRAVGLVPRLNAERAAMEAKSERATQTIAGIAARSSRDEHTGQLIVPSKYGTLYTEQNAVLEATQKGIRRIDSRLKALSNTLRDRLASPRQCGRPEVPELRKLRPLSAELRDLAPLMSDEALRAKVATLAGLLKTTLIANLSPAPPPKAHSHPPAIRSSGDLDTISAAELPVVSEGADLPEMTEEADIQPAGETESRDQSSERELVAEDDSAPRAETTEIIEGVLEPQAVESAEEYFAADDAEAVKEDEDDRIEF